MECSAGKDLIVTSTELKNNLEKLTVALDALLGEFDSMDGLLTTLERNCEEVSVI